MYAINMKLDEVSSTVKKSLWDRKRVLFGIITNGELPEVRLKRETFLIRLARYVHTLMYFELKITTFNLIY